MYITGHCALALCSLGQFNSRGLRYMSLTQGTQSSPLPGEIVCFLLCHLNLLKQNSTWMMAATQRRDFATALCVHSIFPRNIVVAYWFEDNAVPGAVVIYQGAGVSATVWRPLTRKGLVMTSKTGF